MYIYICVFLNAFLKHKASKAAFQHVSGKMNSISGSKIARTPHILSDILGLVGMVSFTKIRGIESLWSTQFIMPNKSVKLSKC